MMPRSISACTACGLLSLSWFGRGSAAPLDRVDASELFSSIDLSTLTKPPLWEPTIQEYFPAQRGGDEEKDENGLPAPVTLSNTTWEEFAYHARKGYPIVVSDWGAGMPYMRWSCRDFAKKFPFGYMKAEYIQDMPGFSRKGHDTKIIDGELRVSIKNFKPDRKTVWYNFTRPASKRYSDDPQKPETGPYVWHVKDELTETQKEKVQKKFQVPKFLNDSLNRAHMNNSFEVWFSPGSGSGAGAHNDGYCESVASLQLRGQKKWRNMLQPEMSFLHSYDEFDGGVYEAGYWKPDLGFVVREGAAVVWPPGYLHETKTLPPEDGMCGSSLTLQFAFPQPVQFIRAFLPRLALSSEVGQCIWKAWGYYAYFFVSNIKPTTNGTVIQGQLNQIFRSIDTDGNGNITVEETRTFFSGRSELIRLQAANHKAGNHDLFFRRKAEDTVAYHDMNEDNVVSKQELWDSLVQWNVVRTRLSVGLKFVNQADREGLEAFEKSLDFMRRTPLELPAKVRPELEEIFALDPKNLPLFNKINDLRSFSDTEFFSPARDKMEEIKEKEKPKPKPKAKAKAKPAGKKEL
mmetsp:Transcript_6349/g.13868  ORF Transcript_6349/g.13868 Transcript_6349/m.13868 type:complete len:574 (+) Transcript_6349:73-1794(+)